MMIRLKYEPTLRDYRLLNHHVMRWVFRVLIAIVGLVICLALALPLALRAAGHSQPINYVALVMAIAPICAAVVF
jgi:ABC-type spermidine/putrescine transport system permease subunit I